MSLFPAMSRSRRRRTPDSVSFRDSLRKFCRKEALVRALPAGGSLRASPGITKPMKEALLNPEAAIRLSPPGRGRAFLCREAAGASVALCYPEFLRHPESHRAAAREDPSEAGGKRVPVPSRISRRGPLQPYESRSNAPWRESPRPGENVRVSHGAKRASPGPKLHRSAPRDDRSAPLKRRAAEIRNPLRRARKHSSMLAGNAREKIGLHCSAGRVSGRHP